MKITEQDKEPLITCDDSSDPQEGYQRANEKKEIYMTEVGTAANIVSWRNGTSIMGTNRDTVHGTRSRDDTEKEILEKDEDRCTYEGNNEEEYLGRNPQEERIRSPTYGEEDEIHDYNTEKK